MKHTHPPTKPDKPPPRPNPVPPTEKHDALSSSPDKEARTVTASVEIPVTWEESPLPRIFVTAQATSDQDSYGAEEWGVRPGVKSGDAVLFYVSGRGIAHAAITSSDAKPVRDKLWVSEFHADGYYRLGETITHDRLMEDAVLREWNLVASGRPFTNLDKLHPGPLEEPIRGALLKVIDSRNPGFLAWLQSSAQNFARSTTAAPHEKADNVPTHGDHPATIDQLGRRAFAQVLAHRIRHVRITENWKQSGTRLSFHGVLLHIIRAVRRALTTPIGVQSVGQRTSGMPPTSGAFMVHMHAPWGAGKTSVLNYIGDELQSSKSEEPWVVVYYNAWRYAHLDMPWWAMMREIYRSSVRQLRELDPMRARLLRLHDVWWRIKGIGPYLVGGGVIAFLVPFNDPGMLKEVVALVVSSGGFLWMVIRYLVSGTARGGTTLLEISGDPMAPLTSHFCDMIRWIGHPVVIFVDDLDRCESPLVVRLLNGTQTLFWDAPAAYVVAADRQWLRSAYENQYRDFDAPVGEAGRPLGFLFLEKLFQISASLPGINQEVRRRYWKRLIGISRDDIDAELDSAGRDARARLRNQRTIAGVVDAIEDAEKQGEDPVQIQALREQAAIRFARADFEEEIEHMLTPFAPLLEANPRAMKRMVNAYGMGSAINLLSGRTTNAEVLALWTIVELRWPLLAEHLLKFPDEVDFFSGEMQATENDPHWKQQLSRDEEVKKVLRGDIDGISAKLGAADIRQCTGFSVSDRTAGAMA